MDIYIMIVIYMNIYVHVYTHIHIHEYITLHAFCIIFLVLILRTGIVALIALCIDLYCHHLRKILITIILPQVLYEDACSQMPYVENALGQIQCLLFCTCVCFGF